jgi:hypothetical protein
MNAAEYVVENRPVSAAHLEGLALATVHIVRAAHLNKVHTSHVKVRVNAKARSRCFKYALDLLGIFFF